jgi:prepilin-type N-terminal cleavage/methylation domain-containing protein
MRNRTLKNTYFNSGFSIVELLIVIVIIAILAAISYVSYNVLLQNSIKDSLQYGLKNAAKQLVVDINRSSTNTYPATLAAANNGGGISFSPSTTVTYNVDNTDNPKTFCLSASQGGQRYFVNQETTPLPGPCPVLYLDAGIQASYPGNGVYWYDLSGYGNNGIMCDCTTFSTNGGGYLIFDGITSAVQIANRANGSFDFGTGSFSAEMWLYFSAYGKDYTDLLDKGAWNPSGTPGWEFGLSTAGIPHMMIEDNLTSDMESDLGTTPVGLNRWHDVTIVFNRASNAVGYIDGVKVGTANISAKSGTVNSTSDAWIGDSADAFNGNIGMVYVRNSALTDTEVQNIFNATRSRFGV